MLIASKDFQVVECLSDADCPSKDCSTWNPPYPGRIAKCVNNICECGPCSVKTDCNNGWCCEKELVGGSGQCRQKGYIYNNNQLCDPPQGFVAVQESTQPENNLLTWVISLFNFLN